MTARWANRGEPSAYHARRPAEPTLGDPIRADRYTAAPEPFTPFDERAVVATFAGGVLRLADLARKDETR